MASRLERLSSMSIVYPLDQLCSNYEDISKALPNCSNSADHNNVNGNDNSSANSVDIMACCNEDTQRVLDSIDFVPTAWLSGWVNPENVELNLHDLEMIMCEHQKLSPPFPPKLHGGTPLYKAVPTAAVGQSNHA